jgi:opacity protein-like surface antigen
MNKLLSLLVVIFSVAYFSTQALAACSLPSGFYLEYNYGASRSMAKTYPGVPTIVNSGTGWNGTLGYKFIPYVAVEGGYTRYADARLENSAGTTAARDRHYGVDVAVKGIFPVMNTGLELFAKAGVVRLVSEIGSVDVAASAVDSLTFDTNGHSAMGLFYGAGVDYAVTKSFLINAQYARANGNSSTGNMNLVSVGISVLIDPLIY